jgi:hypothetical protein
VIDEEFDGFTIAELGLEEFVRVDIDENTIVLHSPPQYQAFNFYCLIFWSQASGELPRYVILFHGECFFDGIRHFWLGSEKTNNYGYYHYADFPPMIAALQKVDDLMMEFCPAEAEERRKQDVVNHDCA